MSVIVFLLILSVLIVVHELGHFITAKKIGVKVEKFSLGFGPRILSRKSHGIEYCINAIPLGGYVKLAGDNLEEYKGNSFEYFAQPPGKRFWIIFFGPFLNYLLGFLFFWLIFLIGYPSLTAKVGGLIDGFGAKDAGIQVGDKIIAVDAKAVNSWEDLQNIIHSKKAATGVRLSILRDNQQQSVNVEIKEKQIDDALGQRHKVGLIGITPAEEVISIRHGVWESFSLAIKKTWSLTLMTYKAVWRMITGKLSLRESVTGPLGIFYITSKAASIGIIAVLHLIAVLSISLSIFNLFPLPVLDGGHILLLGIEKLRGRNLNARTEQVVTQIGLTLIVSLAIIVTYNDLLRFFGDKLSKIFIK